MLYQFIVDQLIKRPVTNFFSKLLFRFFLLLRNNFPGKNKAVVSIKICNFKLAIPFLHNIIIYRRIYPLYSSAVGRIAQYLSSKYPDLSVIDVGANIGDTAAIIKCRINAPILCIEGSEYYAELLKKNVAQFENVFVENIFLGPGGSTNQSFLESGGTGKIIKNSAPNPLLKFDSLGNIVKRHTSMKAIKFVKIDTDGYDSTIIRSESQFLSKHKPVVYFEYDPRLLKENDDDGLSVFNFFADINYNKLLIYNNYGEYLLMTEVNNTFLLRDIHQFYLRFGVDRYCDMCVFHNDDNDIADLIRTNESIFFDDYAFNPNH